MLNSIQADGCRFCRSTKMAPCLSFVHPSKPTCSKLNTQMQNNIFTPLLCCAEPSAFDHLCKRRSRNEYIIIILLLYFYLVILSGYERFGCLQNVERCCVARSIIKKKWTPPGSPFRLMGCSKGVQPTSKGQDQCLKLASIGSQFGHIQHLLKCDDLLLVVHHYPYIDISKPLNWITRKSNPIDRP